jgi:hypothetical protein
MAEWIPPGGAFLAPPGQRTASAANPDAFPQSGERPKTANLAALSRQGVLRPQGTASSRKYGPEAEQDEKNSHSVAKRQALGGSQRV